jgi:hypothetical protein
MRFASAASRSLCVMGAGFSRAETARGFHSEPVQHDTQRVDIPLEP